ncbi:MAG: hypothetical protein ABI557_16990 [Aureliella sp.]
MLLNILLPFLGFSLACTAFVILYRKTGTATLRSSMVAFSLLAVLVPLMMVRAAAPTEQGEKPRGENTPASDDLAKPHAPAGVNLKLSILSVTCDNEEAVSIQVAFENVGNEDTVLNVGRMLANGKVQLPSALRLLLTDKSGQLRELHWKERMLVATRNQLRIEFAHLHRNSNRLFDLRVLSTNT